MKKLIVAAALLAAVLPRMAMAYDDLTVEVGQTVTIDRKQTNGTVTVKGTLKVNAELDFITALNIEGGTVEVWNSGRVLSDVGVLSVGYAGIDGTLIISNRQASTFLPQVQTRFLEIGAGGGKTSESTIAIGTNAMIQSRYLTKQGQGIGNLVFAEGGSYVSTWTDHVFDIQDGTLKLSGDAITILHSAGNTLEKPALLFNDGGTAAARLVTTGAGPLVLWEKQDQKFGLFLNKPEGGLVWGHAGGFVLGTGEGGSTMYDLGASDDWFTTNGAPADLRLNVATLNIHELNVPVASIEGWGTVMGAAGGQGTIVLGTNDVDVELSGINGLPEFKDLTVRKVGTGVLTLSLGGFSVPLRIESGVARVPYFQPAVYSHYRFVIDEGVGAGREAIQIMNFSLLGSVEDGFADVTARRSGFTYGEGANDREGNNQGVGNMFDGSDGTKWMTMKTGAGNAEPADKANCWFQIDFDAPQTVAFYDWQIAWDCYNVNSPDCRLPWKWRLLGSDDGESWTLVDERTLDKSRQYTIREWTGPYGAGDARVFSQSMGPNFDFSAPVTIAGGVFDVNHPVRCVGLTQTGGKVKIGEHGSISLLGALWTGADFTDDSSGAIEVVGGMTSTISAGSSLAFKGNVVVRDGTLLVGAGARHRATSDRLFRFTIKKTCSDAACTQLSGLRILDGDGNILSGGLDAADPGTDPTQLAAGSCCYAEGYSQGGSSKVEHLFDGDTGTKMCLTSLTMGNADITKNTWRTVYFRLPTDKTALAVAYQLTTANDATPSRNPSIWTLESSADGIHWSVVDERTPGEFVNPSKTFTDFNAGTPLDLRQAVYLPKIDNGVTFSAGSGFSVQDGALLKVADGQAVDGLFGEGRVEGSVTVQTFEAAGDSSGLKVTGTLTIAANPEFRIVGFPAEFEETGLANGVTVTVAEANGIVGAENLAQATFPGLSSVKHGAAKAFVEDGKLKVTVYGVKPGFAILLK